MSNYQNKDNSGVLFKNDRRDPDSRQPEYTGSLTIDGVDYWLNAWVKEKNGRKYFSLATKPKEQQKQENRQRLNEATKELHKPGKPGFRGHEFEGDPDSIPF